MFLKIKNKNLSVIFFCCSSVDFWGCQTKKLIQPSPSIFFCWRKETTHLFYCLGHCHKVKESYIMDSSEISRKTLVIAFYFLFTVSYLCIFLEFAVTGVKSLNQIQCFTVTISLIDPFHSQCLNFLFKANDSQILPSISFYSCDCLLASLKMLLVLLFPHSFSPLQLRIPCSYASFHTQESMLPRFSCIPCYCTVLVFKFLQLISRCKKEYYKYVKMFSLFNKHFSTMFRNILEHLTEVFSRPKKTLFI